MKKFIVTGAIHAFLAVALGAFAAHGLKDVLDTYSTGIWNTAVQYQMFHAGGLLAVGILMSRKLMGDVKLLNIAGWCMNIGILLFAGSLYTIAVTGIGKLGAVTPFGGVFFLISWGCLMMAVIKEGR